VSGPLCGDPSSLGPDVTPSVTERQQPSMLVRQAHQLRLPGLSPASAHRFGFASRPVRSNDNAREAPSAPTWSTTPRPGARPGEL
jgi:hypothetical protein